MNEKESEQNFSVYGSVNDPAGVNGSRLELVDMTAGERHNNSMTADADIAFQGADPEFGRKTSIMLPRSY